MRSAGLLCLLTLCLLELCLLELCLLELRIGSLLWLAATSIDATLLVRLKAPPA